MRRPAAIAVATVTVALLMSVAMCSRGVESTMASPSRAEPSITDKVRRLERLDPCRLLTSAEVGQFGAATGEATVLADTPACQWIFPDGRVVDVGLDDRNGVGALVVGAGKLTMTVVGQHDARQVAENAGPGVCVVSLAVTPSSRVDVVAVVVMDTAAACGIANQVAKFVEPRLP